MIPIDQCEDRRLYRVNARNFTLGVYDAGQCAFIGIRTKFYDRFLDREFHWNYGGPHGTARPEEALPVTFPGDLGLDENDPLFNWLEEAEKTYNTPTQE